MGQDHATTALAPYAYEPGTISEGLELARALHKSQLLGRAYGTPEAVFAVVVAGRELGLPAMTALRSMHIVEGRPILSADLLVARARALPSCEYLHLAESTASRCVYVGKRREDPAATRIEWTAQDATRAGLGAKDNWRKYPAAMLRHRAGADIVRALWPEAALGVYCEEEADDIRQSDRDRAIPANMLPLVPVPPPPAPQVDPPAPDTETQAAPPDDVPEWPLESQADTFAGRIANAASVPELAALGAEIKAATLDKPTRDDLARAYATRKRELLLAATAPREPGEEG